MAQALAHHALGLAGILFVLGLLGVLVRRNVVFVLLSIEVMLNAVSLAFVAAAARWGQPDGQVMYILVLSTAAAETAVGLALVLQLSLRANTLATDQLKTMRG